MAITILKKLFGMTDPTPPTPEVSTPPAENSEEASSDGPLTESQKQLVFDSWEKVRPISETAASLFYAKLFELDPEVKHSLRQDGSQRAGKEAHANDRRCGHWTE